MVRTLILSIFFQLMTAFISDLPDAKAFSFFEGFQLSTHSHNRRQPKPDTYNNHCQNIRHRIPWRRRRTLSRRSSRLRWLIFYPMIPYWWWYPTNGRIGRHKPAGHRLFTENTDVTHHVGDYVGILSGDVVVFARVSSDVKKTRRFGEITRRRNIDVVWGWTCYVDDDVLKIAGDRFYCRADVDGSFFDVFLVGGSS